MIRSPKETVTRSHVEAVSAGRAGDHLQVDPTKIWTVMLTPAGGRARVQYTIALDLDDPLAVWTDWKPGAIKDGTQDTITGVTGIRAVTGVGVNANLEVRG